MGSIKHSENLNDVVLLFGAVSSDFTADEKMEIESIKTHKKDLLDDIQVHDDRKNKNMLFY